MQKRNTKHQPLEQRVDDVTSKLKELKANSPARPSIYTQV